MQGALANCLSRSASHFLTKQCVDVTAIDSVFKQHNDISSPHYTSFASYAIVKVC